MNCNHKVKWSVKRPEDCRFRLSVSHYKDRIVAPDEYSGVTEVTPSDSVQTLATKDKTVRLDITVNPAPTEPLSTTENGTFTPSESNVGFSSVTVDVEPTLESLSVTENGLYLPESGVDGFDRVSVDVPQEITLDDLATGAKPTGDVVITSEAITRNNAFPGLPMSTVSLPNLTTVSGQNSFQNCTNLTSVDAPNLETISAQGFLANCGNLTSVNFPKLQSITAGAIFQSCAKLKEIVLPKATEITTYIANGRTGLDGAVIKLGSKATLGARVFNGCMRTGDIYLPWSEGEVSGAPWEAPTGATIHYDTVYDSEWNVISST